MKIKLFFDPVPESIWSALPSASGLGNSFQIHGKGGLTWKSAELAFFSIQTVPSETGPDWFRKALYRLTQFSRPCKVVDLGYLRPGKDLEDTIARLGEVCETLMAQNTLPIIIGGEHKLDIGQFKGYENLQKMVCFLNIDSVIDLQSGEESQTATDHIRQILMFQPNFLFDFAHLAYQRFLNDPKTLHTLEKLNFETLSVGQIRDHFQNTEPVIRSADLISFDLGAIKKGEIPTSNPHQTPFGLTPEEACQLCWYAGLNDQLSSIGFYNYYPLADTLGHGAEVLAIMVWYFMEGFAHRKQEFSFQSNFYIKYIVPIEAQNLDMVFYKSRRSGKWWMEVANTASEENTIDLQRQRMIPCSYSDYETALKGELPDRWLKTVGKML